MAWMGGNVQKLNENSGKLLYHQLEDAIREKIKDNTWKPDSQIPTESQLMEMFDVSRVTVRKAVEGLVEEGRLVKIRGRGTFVAPQTIRKQIVTFQGFSEFCRNTGRKPSSKVIGVELKPVNKKIRDFFQIEQETLVLIIKRVRMADGQPVIYETNYFPESYKFLTMENLEDSLYEILQKKGIVPQYSVKELDVCVANNDEGEYLKISDGTPLLLIDELVYDSEEKPLHICKQVIRTAVFKYVICS